MEVGSGFWSGVLLGSFLAVIISHLAQLLFFGKIGKMGNNVSSDKEGEEQKKEPQLDISPDLLTLSSSAELMTESDDSSSEDGNSDDMADEDLTTGSSSDAQSTDSCSASPPVNAPHFPFLRVQNLIQNSWPQRVFPNSRDFQAFKTPCSNQWREREREREQLRERERERERERDEGDNQHGGGECYL